MTTERNATATATASTSTEANPGGLVNVNQVVQLADQLSACADQIHERVMLDIKAHDGRPYGPPYGSPYGPPIPEAKQAALRALLEDEVVLRQRANGLYADAATYVVKSLGKPQAQLIALTTDAAEKIRKITLIGDITGLVAGLLSLAGAAATGQAAPILLALRKIETQITALDEHNPQKPPSPAT